MAINFFFQKVVDASELNQLKKAWLDTLNAPQDGMWEAFMNFAPHWLILIDKQIVGYACVDSNNYLLQFFVLPAWLIDGPDLLKKFILEQNINHGIIGTNNPVSLSIAMHLQRSVSIHTYLFADYIPSQSVSKKAKLITASKQDLERLVDFCHMCTGGAKSWLKEYIGDLIEKQEYFMLEKGNEIVGICEVRKSISNPAVADLGMIVSPKFRKQGWGTYFIGKAKEIAIQWDRKPICSCEKDNIGSLKAIQRNGFRSVHQMLLVSF